jgi:RNA-directed DNA polymerase
MNTNWNQIIWKTVDIYVWKMQTRIYKASIHGKKEEVHRLQDILVCSNAAKLKAVRQITQDNRFPTTPGTTVEDVRRTRIPPSSRGNFVKTLSLDGQSSPPSSLPAKDSALPTMKDRAKQALALLALEPEWEAKFEANNYGFRPGRTCQDAIEAIYLSINQKPKYVLVAHIAKCFDQINHEALLSKISTFPAMHKQIKAWLKAGILDGPEASQRERPEVPLLVSSNLRFPSVRINSRFLSYSPEGTSSAFAPGGPAGFQSPMERLASLLANIAFHGIENMLKEYVMQRTVRDQRGKVLKRSAKKSQRCVIRYANDLIILHPEVEVIQECKTLMEDWLKPIGFELKPSKTRICHTKVVINSGDHEQTPGFNFLGFYVRQYGISKFKVRASKVALPFRTLIKPQKEKTLLHIRQLGQIIKNTQKIEVLLAKINPVITRWAKYYRSAVSYRIFKWCDTWLYHKLFRWACKKHSQRGAIWVRKKYFLSRGSRNWVFAYFRPTINGEQQMISLNQHAATLIERHVKVQGTRSPYDGDLTYWGSRLAKYGTLSKEMSMLLKRQNARCAWCNLPFLPSDILERDHVTPVSRGGKDKINNLQILHGHCHDEKTAKERAKQKNARRSPLPLGGGPTGEGNPIGA